ncbi:membrane transport protein-domain-containing protein [Lactifluus volemus]|nr:membrane transport protein-domain-containing protein [Lactifluus volemus]
MSTHNQSPIWPLFQTVLGSIVQVILVCISGYVLARRGIIDKPTQRQLNIINVNFFTPCLLFSKVAFFLSPAKLAELWIIPIFFLFVSGVSLVTAWLLGSLFRLRPSQRNFAMAAATFMNSNSLPVALLQSLAVSVPGLKWGEDDTKDAIIGRALTYLLLCSTIGQFLRWSYGVHLLTKSDDTLEGAEDSSRPHEGSTLTREGDQPQPPFGIYHDNPSQALAGRGSRRRHSAHIFYSFPSTPYLPTPQLSPDSEATSVFESDTDSDDDERVPLWSRPPPTFLQRVGRKVRNVWKKVTGFLTPPLWASIVSLLVALNPPLQHVLEVHMRPVQGAITQAGNCSIPLTLISNPNFPPLVRTAGETVSCESLRDIFRLKDREDVRRSPALQSVIPGETRTIFVAIFARMVVSVFILSNVLLLASPPALTLAQITQAVSSVKFERLVSRTIFWSYCLVTPPAMVGYALIAMLITRL